MSSIEIGLIAGLTWSVVLTVWALVSVTSGEISKWLVLLTCIYDGFDFTPKGIIIGALWAFFDGCLTGFVFSYIINLLIG